MRSAFGMFLVVAQLSSAPIYPAGAGPVEDVLAVVDDANAAFERGDFKEGFRLLRPRDEHEEALRLLHPLAGQGSASAQTQLGIIYLSGLGGADKLTEAAKWFRKAADQDVARAQNFLGALYQMGAGVPQNRTEAVRWNRKAADQGYAPAQCSLGQKYATGYLVPKDVIAAHMWLSLCTSRGHDAALDEREMVEKEMTPEQIAEAQRMAREWKPD